jgi:flagellar capping protein FliD
MTLKTTAKTIGSGLLDGLAAVHNASIQREINEIDERIKAMQDQLVQLNEERKELESRRCK